VRFKKYSVEFTSMLSRKTSFKFPFIANSDPAAAAQRLVASALFCCLLLVPPHVRAQLSLGEVVIGDTTAEESVEASVEEQVAEQVEEQAIEQVEERVLSLGGPPDEVIESTIEESIEESVVDNIEEDVAEEVADSVEEAVQESIVQDIEEDIVDNVEEIVEETVAENLEEDIEESIEQEIEQNLTQEVEQEIEISVATAIESSVTGDVEREIDQLLLEIESEIEIDKDRINKNEWLVMAEPEVFEELAKEGYLFDRVTDLPGIGMRLAEVAAPSSFDISETRQGVIDVVGTGRAKVDLNHIYTAGVRASVVGDGVMPRNAIAVPPGIDALPLRIGMIDSLVDVSHPSLNAANIESRSFVSDSADLPDFHGTAIASILVANTNEYTGLAPKADVFAAAVFERDDDKGEFASTVSLVLALDWLVGSGVNVINISLAGPPNRLLEAALTQAEKRDVLVVAAAGNGGPAAKPMYPAAYDSVIAVTAVDSDGLVFRLANRGNYLDLAAPGVGLQHARAGGGYIASSGTSFAVPFVVTAAARLRSLQPTQDVRELLYKTAKDLGPEGRDDIYGYGLLDLGSG
jgi:hypothetical protein